MKRIAVAALLAGVLSAPALAGRIDRVPARLGADDATLVPYLRAHGLVQYAGLDLPFAGMARAPVMGGRMEVAAHSAARLGTCQPGTPRTPHGSADGRPPSGREDR